MRVLSCEVRAEVAVLFVLQSTDTKSKLGKKWIVAANRP